MTNALRALLLVLVTCFLGVIGYSLQDRSAKEGGAAPSFSIKADDGRTITPTSFGGKVLVLNFWATWCAPCIQEIPSLNQFSKEFAPQGVVVLAVNIDQNEQKYRKFLQRIPVSFEAAYDAKADLSAEYGTFLVPETYIIKDGRVMRKYAEAVDWTNPDVTQYVKGLL
jgi:thiol-disulfide isomerase/thioredoxin